MFSKHLSIVVVLFVLVTFFSASICFAEEGWRTNSGVGASADWDKIAPGMYYNTAYKAYFHNRTYFEIGGVKLSWTPSGGLSATENGRNRFEIPLYPIGQTPLKFCNIRSLDSVDDPSALTFTKPGKGKLTHQSVKIVNGKYVASKPSAKPVKGNITVDTATPEGGQLFAGSCVGRGLVFEVRDDFYIGLEALDIKTEIRYQQDDGSTSMGGVMEYKWKTWTWVESPNKMFQQARNQ